MQPPVSLFDLLAVWFAENHNRLPSLSWKELAEILSLHLFLITAPDDYETALPFATLDPMRLQ